jgi:hypothetical protein
MPAVPPIVDTLIDRMYSKGTRLYWSLPNAPVTGLMQSSLVLTTPAFLLAGVVKINGPQMKRQGLVDCTELAPQPIEGASPAFYPVDAGTDLVRTAETYFTTFMLAGTKDQSPIGMTLNMRAQTYYNLWYWYTRDTQLQYRIQYRNGTYHVFNAQINELPSSIEDNKLVEVEW